MHASVRVMLLFDPAPDGQNARDHVYTGNSFKYGPSYGGRTWITLVRKARAVNPLLVEGQVRGEDGAVVGDVQVQSGVPSLHW